VFAHRGCTATPVGNTRFGCVVLGPQNHPAQSNGGSHPPPRGWQNPSRLRDLTRVPRRPLGAPGTRFGALSPVHAPATGCSGPKIARPIWPYLLSRRSPLGRAAICFIHAGVDKAQMRVRARRTRRTPARIVRAAQPNGVPPPPWGWLGTPVKAQMCGQDPAKGRVPAHINQAPGALKKGIISSFTPIQLLRAERVTVVDVWGARPWPRAARASPTHTA
jgi:hypothetical protein